MLLPLLLLQLATPGSRTAPTYGTPALAAFIDTAAAANRQPPPALRGYHADVESELSLILRDTLGREAIAQVEEVALRARWHRGGDYNLHVVGYRSASVGVPYSALSFTRSWTIPSLYGDRLMLGVDIVGGNWSRRPASKRDSLKERSSPRVFFQAIHPLAIDRSRFYRFDGGDTIAFVRSGDRVIPISRVRVTPVLDSIGRDTTITAFDGEIEFDASRHQIVRMRGRFVTRSAARPGLRARLAELSGVVAVAFVEFVNAESGERYWLPEYQRTEFQASLAPLGSQRSVLRIVSHFTHVATEIDTVAEEQSGSIQSAGELLRSPNAGARDDGERARRVLSYAKGDSVSRYSNWLRPLGTATSDVSAADFDDFLPDPWRPHGRPRLEFAPTRLDEVFRYDRVEGAYSGAAMGLRFRDAAPGLSARAYGGWAWSEQTARGGGTVGFSRNGSSIAGRFERLLVSTNDFTAPLERGTIGFAGLFGADDQDYIDRRVATLGLTKTIGSVHNVLMTTEAGWGEDRAEAQRLSHGPFGIGSFRLNRGSADGRYWRGAATIEVHPDVTGLFLDPGLGLVGSYEIARGQLNWQRAELTVAGRRNISDFELAGRAQGGLVLGQSIPPQQLFETGGEGALPGYGYKQFAGDRAAVAGLLVGYRLPLLRRPWRLVRSLIIPGLSPGLAAGVQSGWVEASSENVSAAIRRLDPYVPAGCVDSPGPSCPSPLSTPTGGVRATVDVRLTMFGGLLGVGVARAVDRSEPWRLVFRFGQEY